ncbi:hypothetical protein [Microbulbifer taiwanensis]|uniref:Uncharacterized protein n=3 Tax=Microbulbifer taiwanensis TaxID=986746 RepID=A0ABW1YSW7_9GAMM|nr:hypothetical protein [Microbulbifer taiwanensis]
MTRTTRHPVFGAFQFPFTVEDVAAICEVSLRTAERWWNLDAQPPRAAIKLVQITLRGRVMPDSWPHCWRFGDDRLITNLGADSVRWQDIETYDWVKKSWYEAMRLIVQTEARVESLLRKLPEDARAELTGHRARLEELRTQDRIAERWRLAHRETHRQHGC